MSNTRKCLLVLEATIGGTRRHLRDLALGLSARGWTLHIVYAARREKDFLRDISLFREKDIVCTEVDMKRGPAPLSDFAAVLRLRRLIRDFQPDVIHLHSTKAGLLGRLAAGGGNAKVIYTPHCFAFEMESPLRKLYFLMEKALVPLTDTLIAVCHDEAAAAARLGYPAKRIRCIHNGLDAGKRIPASSQKKNYDICFAGRACRQKGLDLLTEAYRKLLQFRPGTTLAVMSDAQGRTRNELEKLGAKILPFGTTDDTLALLRQSTILVMPSRWEAFPYTPLEAFSAGVPVVAFDVGGIREAVRDRENGLLVAKGDVDALAAAMREVLADPPLMARLARGAATSAAVFPLPQMLDETERLYLAGK